MLHKSMASSFAFPCFYDTESHGFGRGRLPRSASAPRNGRPEHQRRPTPMWKLESFKAFLEEKTHSLRPSASPASRSSGICTTRPSDFEWRCRGWLVPGPANDVVPQGRGWHLPCSRSHGSGSGGHRSIKHPSRGKQQQRQKKKKTRKKKKTHVPGAHVSLGAPGTRSGGSSSWKRLHHRQSPPCAGTHEAAGAGKSHVVRTLSRSVLPGPVSDQTFSSRNLAWTRGGGTGGYSQLAPSRTTC